MGGANSPVERQAADVIAVDVARHGHDDTRQRKGVPPPIGCLPLIGLAILVGLAGLAIGYWGFGNPQPGPTAAPTSSPTAPPTATPAPSATATPSASPTVSPSPAPSITAVPTVTASPSPAGPSGQITGYCVRIRHDQLGNFVSQIQWFMAWTGVVPDYFELVVIGANDGDPVELVLDTATGEWFGRLGVHSTGTKRIVSLVAHWPDGTSSDLTDEVIDAFGGDEINVRFPQEDEYGDCP